MAEGLFTLLIYCVLMAVASLAAGMLPLAVSLSQSQLRLISTIGMGVLVGTSLIVIIPEGIETIYNTPKPAPATMPPQPQPLPQAQSQPQPPSPQPATADIHARGSWVVDWTALRERDLDMASVVPRGGEEEKAGEHPQSHSGPLAQKPVEASPPHHDDKEGHHDHHDGEENSPHKWVGFSLVSGFILMYLIDVLPSHARSPSDGQPYHIAIDNLRGSMASPTPPSPHAPKPSAVTLGLVIHAAADGIALGASSASQNLALGAIVFLAIMLHKAPAAFGLTAVLLRGGLSKHRIRAHLSVFSLAAPAGAVVTWIVVNVLGAGTAGDAGVQWWTGVLLLFSGGTFLYVAMHTMQDQAAQLQGSGQKSTLKDVLAAVFGMVLPLATQIGHHHH